MLMLLMVRKRDLLNLGDDAVHEQCKYIPKRIRPFLYTFLEALFCYLECKTVENSF